MNDIRPVFQKFVYELCKAVGVKWLVDKIPFLEPRQWVKDIEKCE